MNSLVFLTNNLQSPSTRRKYLLQAEPIGIGILHAKMYNQRGDTFCAETSNKAFGNSVVYGTLYHIKNFEHFKLALDAYHDCSLSLIGREHVLDLQKRVERDIILINPRDTDSLLNLDYMEKTTVKSHVYLANTTHQTISKKINCTNSVYRVQSGLCQSLITQWEEIWQSQNMKSDMEMHSQE